MRLNLLRAGGTVLALSVAVNAYGQDGSAESPHRWTANAPLVSDYVFRGLTQSSERPAIQGGFDYAHAGGAYAGVWLSNVGWFSDTNAGNSNSLEWDLCGGFKKTWVDGLSTDIEMVSPKIFLRVQRPVWRRRQQGLGLPRSHHFGTFERARFGRRTCRSSSD